MPDLWLGPDSFRFEEIVINRLIWPGQTGNYVLGLKDESGEFVPKYIGRSDTDLRGEMMSKLATMKYPYFKYSIGHPVVAFEIECAQFHNFRKTLENRSHPASPEGLGLKCFLCGL